MGVGRSDDIVLDMFDIANDSFDDSFDITIDSFDIKSLCTVVKNTYMMCIY